MNVTELEVRPQGREEQLNRSLECAQSGREDATSDLMRMTPGLLRAVLRRVRVESETARSVLQDAWVSAWQRLAEFRTASHLWRWVYRVRQSFDLAHPAARWSSVVPDGLSGWADRPSP